jgi:hypothetical protein
VPLQIRNALRTKVAPNARFTSLDFHLFPNLGLVILGNLISVFKQKFEKQTTNKQAHTAYPAILVVLGLKCKSDFTINGSLFCFFIYF